MNTVYAATAERAATHNCTATNIVTTACKFLSVLLISVSLVACGGGNPGSGTSNTNNAVVVGERMGEQVSMQPGPPAYTFPASSGSGPSITIDQVTPYSANVTASGTDINQATTQVVFGQVTGSSSGDVVIVYSYTNQYYIQPLTNTTINITSTSTWTAPASAGQITALLVAQGYTAPNTTVTLPAVDGVNVLAVTTQP